MFGSAALADCCRAVFEYTDEANVGVLFTLRATLRRTPWLYQHDLNNGLSGAGSDASSVNAEKEGRHRVPPDVGVLIGGLPPPICRCCRFTHVMNYKPSDLFKNVTCQRLHANHRFWCHWKKMKVAVAFHLTPSDVFSVTPRKTNSSCSWFLSR